MIGCLESVDFDSLWFAHADVKEELFAVFPLIALQLHDFSVLIVLDDGAVAVVLLLDVFDQQCPWWISFYT